MATDVVMPQMGESIAEGTIVRWIKKVGDKIDRDEPLFEISTDKVDAEIPSPAAGVISEIRVKEGETVPINSVVAVIGAAADVAATAPAAAKPAAPVPPSPPAGALSRSSRAGTGAAAGRERQPRSRATAACARSGAAGPGRGETARGVSRRSDSRALVAAGPEDREGTSGRHLADSRHRHRRPGHQGRHSRLHRQGRQRPGRPRQRAGRAPRGAGKRCSRVRRRRSSRPRAIALRRCR